MAHIHADLVRETTTTTGTGTYDLGGAVTNFRDFDSVMADNDTCFYTVRLGSGFESGIGTFTSGSPDTLARTTILESSNSNNAVSWGSGAKDIYMSTPSKAMWASHSATLNSASTTDLGSVTAPMVDISGTSAITSFGSSAPKGAVKFGRFSGALTLTHNATSLILPGGANITTVDGATFVARHEGSGNWRVQSYTDPSSSPVGTTGTMVHKGLVDLSASSAGQIKFPGTQNASSNVNTLDDYEEGTFTPGLTFLTPGNLSVTYIAQVGSYTKIGNLVRLSFHIVTATFTHTTASGQCFVTGVPFASANVTNNDHECAGLWEGITKANYTDVAGMILSNQTQIGLMASGSGQTFATVTAADMPTGTQKTLKMTLCYQTAT